MPGGRVKLRFAKLRMPPALCADLPTPHQCRPHVSPNQTAGRPAVQGAARSETCAERVRGGEVGDLRRAEEGRRGRRPAPSGDLRSKGRRGRRPTPSGDLRSKGRRGRRPARRADGEVGDLRRAEVSFLGSLRTPRPTRCSTNGRRASGNPRSRPDQAPPRSRQPSCRCRRSRGGTPHIPHP